MVSHIVHLEDDHHLFNIFRVALLAVSPALKIVQFTDAELLLRYVLQADSPIDLVILDIRVPGSLNGIQVAQQIRRVQYPVNIVITSAYSAPERRVLSELDAIFIPKPWNIPAMIRQLLSLEVDTQAVQAKPKPPPQAAAVTPVTGGMTSFILQEKSVQRVTHLLEFLQTALHVSGAAVLVGSIQDANIQHVIALPALWQQGKIRLFLESFATQIFQKQNPLFVEDVRPYLNRQASLQNIISYAGIPFDLSDSRYQGVLCVLDSKVRTWQKHDYEVLCKTAELLQETLETDNFINLLVARNDALFSYSSTIAHDLKSPLGAIIGYADVVKLLMGDGLPAQVEKYLTSITDSATIMSDMITRLLWLAKLDHPLAATEVVDMHIILPAVLMRLQYQIDRRGMTMLIPEELPLVVGHEAWIEEVFANLISNAIKYIGDDNPNPTIAIQCGRVGDQIRFEVEDNGIGISAEDQAKLFTSFSRLHKVQVEGLGLGLVIVHRIVTNLGGQLGVESEPGKGSVFWFTLPAAD